MSANLITKRDVREHVKVTLEPLLEDGTIDAEHLKSLVKSVPDAIGLPASPSQVQQQILDRLLTTLEEEGTDAEVIDRVRARLPSPSGEEKPPLTLASETGDGLSNAPTTAARPAPFDLGMLKAHMSKKREELHQRRELVVKPHPAVEAKEVVSGVPRAAVAVEAVQAEGRVGTTSKVSSGRRSECTMATRSALPDGGGAPAGLASPSEGTTRVPLSAEGCQSERAAPIALTAAPVEEDLYADLITPQRERTGLSGGHRGGWGARGSRGRGGWRGAQRPPIDEAFHPFYPPPEGGYVPKRASKNWQGYNAQDYNYYSRPY